MRKSSKGMIAASAAALLLIGSWGTHASWSSDTTVGGKDINTGHLDLVNAQCGAWKLDVAGLLRDFDPIADLLAPGDLLSRTCTFEVSAAGVNLKAQVSASTPQFTGNDVLSDALDVDVDFVRNGSSIGNVASISDGQTITVNVQVAFTDTGVVDNLTQSLSTHLDDIVVTASQV